MLAPRREPLNVNRNRSDHRAGFGRRGTRKEGAPRPGHVRRIGRSKHRQRLCGVASKGAAPERRGVGAMQELGEATLQVRELQAEVERAVALARTIGAPSMESPLASASFNDTVAAYARFASSGAHGASGGRQGGRV